MIIVYTKVCAPCRYRAQLSHVKRYARFIGAEYKVVELIGQPEKERLVRQLSNLDLPFVYNDQTQASESLGGFNQETKI